MSLQSWMEIYYKDDAWNVEKDDAVSHSINKWRGLSPEILKEHGLRRADYVIKEINSNIDEGLVIASESCALCHHYNKYSECTDCPLYDVHQLACDDGRGSPYKIWRETGNNLPMLNDLESI